MSFATDAGFAPRDPAIAHPELVRRFRRIADEAEHIIRKGFDFDENPFHGDLGAMARIRREALSYLRPMPLDEVRP